ncbi:hypothetical protein [Polynucleobacter sp. es-EL-1]|uniref:hypothetical protein n=1 Tax=Polynucleobacter sp. es-EL-1 TaxID=1855652 RepID=UPI001BFE8A59|nr:hypothetical protein [Polynucleobacter sp. es-EL-1]QWE10827.1 hypothetical protein FD974_01385 [Polynucleobacter sp. es-EL-1]
MIIAWVLSLLVLISSLIANLERMTTLEIISSNTVVAAGKQFIAAEKNLDQCERDFINIANHANSPCHLQSAGKNLWLISTKQSPRLEILVRHDEKTGAVNRLNWRQQFE